MSRSRDRARPERGPTAAEARAEVEARRRAEREARRAEPRPRGPLPGRAIIVASWASTALLVVASVPAAIDPEALLAPAFVVWLVLFFGGSAVTLWAFLVAVGRSRTHAIGIGGLYFLAGTAPRAAQVHLLGSFATQVVASVAVAAADPFTPLAFATLTPVAGLGFAGLWGARHGTFEER